MQRQTLVSSDPQDIARAYERGFVGAYWNAASAQQLGDDIESAGGTRYGEEACRDYAIAGVGEGKLSLTFMAVQQNYPNAIPGRAQERGDCVSFSTRTAVWQSYVNDLIYGSNPDGHALPAISPTAEKSGCISTETYYWLRGHSGDGWQCAEAADVAIKRNGMWLRQNYPELGIDLTDYSPQLAGKWGSSPPPEKILSVGRQTLCRTATVCRTYESVRDMLATGNGISSCGSEAFKNVRNKYGIADRSNTKWYHAMAYGGVDDRPETVAREGCGLVLVVNSWGSNWISGNTQIAGTNLHIPQGCFWARWSDIESRYAVAFGSSHGWPARPLPDWGLGEIV